AWCSSRGWPAAGRLRLITHPSLSHARTWPGKTTGQRLEERGERGDRQRYSCPSPGVWCNGPTSGSWHHINTSREGVMKRGRFLTVTMGAVMLGGLRV